MDLAYAALFFWWLWSFSCHIIMRSIVSHRYFCSRCFCLCRLLHDFCLAERHVSYCQPYDPFYCLATTISSDHWLYQGFVDSRVSSPSWFDRPCLCFDQPYLQLGDFSSVAAIWGVLFTCYRRCHQQTTIRGMLDNTISVGNYIGLGAWPYWIVGPLNDFNNFFS